MASLYFQKYKDGYTTIVFIFLFYFQVVSSQILKSETLTPSNTNRNGAQIITNILSVITFNNSWKSTINSQSGWQFIVLLDNSWGFDPLISSSINITINAPITTGIATFDALIVAFTTDNVQHISTFIPMDNSDANKIYPQCESTSELAQAHAIGDIATLPYYHRKCDVVDPPCSNWDYIFPRNLPNELNTFPITFVLENNPDTNTLRLSFKSNAFSPTFDQYCFFKSAATNKGLKIYIGGNDIGQIFDIKSIQIHSMAKAISPIQPTTVSPTNIPTYVPTIYPTHIATTLNPIHNPTNVPTTISSTNNPTETPTNAPTTTRPINAPTTTSPTNNPITSPTSNPTTSPTNNPTTSPSNPTISTTNNPTISPTNNPATHSTRTPTEFITTITSTENPTISPSTNPSTSPTDYHIRANLASSSTMIELIPVLEFTPTYTSTSTTHQSSLYTTDIATHSPSSSSIPTLILTDTHSPCSSIVPTVSISATFPIISISSSNLTSESIATTLVEITLLTYTIRVTHVPVVIDSKASLTYGKLLIMLALCITCLGLFRFLLYYIKRIRGDVDVPPEYETEFDPVQSWSVMHQHLIRVHFGDRKFKYSIHEERDMDGIIGEYRPGEYQWNRNTFDEFIKAVVDVFDLHYAQFRLYELVDGVEEDIHEIDDLIVAFDSSINTTETHRSIDVYVQIIDNSVEERSIEIEMPYTNSSAKSTGVITDTSTRTYTFTKSLSDTGTYSCGCDNAYQDTLDRSIKRWESILVESKDTRSRHRAFKKIGLLEERRGNVKKAIECYVHAMQLEECDDDLEEKVLELMDINSSNIKSSAQSTIGNPFINDRTSISASSDVDTAITFNFNFVNNINN